MAANNANINLGPAVVTFSGTLAGIAFDGYDFGAFSADGVAVTWNREEIRVASDQTGVTPAKIFEAGTSATVTMTILETELFDNTLIPFPGAVSGTNDVTTYGEAAGFDVLNNWSGRLILTPTDNTRRVLEFYQVVPVGSPSRTYATNEGAAGLSISFEAILDLTRPAGDRLGKSSKGAGA